MKRIFQPDHRYAKKSALQVECKEVSAAKEAAKEAAQWTMIDQLELPDAKSRKLDSFTAPAALHEFSGAPKSAAEMAQIYLTAKGKNRLVLSRQCCRHVTHSSTNSVN